ncbi:MAG: hypothetical protein HYV28_18380 [Ignavibacteriales bacterium]|nr:hypothetical protein [Ignavibacteriales bacterium]
MDLKKIRDSIVDAIHLIENELESVSIEELADEYNSVLEGLNKSLKVLEKEINE